MNCRSPMLALVFVFPLICSCGSDQLSIEKRRANRPPETMLSGGPSDSASGVNYKVHLWWSGSDADGTIDHFDFILVDHPAIKDNLDGDGDDAVMIEVPAHDDPRWMATSAHDSVFVTLADTLRHDPQPDDSTSADDIRNMLLERWHTYFIRAVDDEGNADPTPDYVSFNSTNLAPRVWLTHPVRAGVTLHAPVVVRFAWDGEDPVGDGDVIEPVASRWVLVSSQIDMAGEPTHFPDSLETLPPTHAWSPWVSWHASDGRGRQAVRNQLQQFRELENGRVEGFYLFAVQALDEAGARTLVFDRHTPYKNNVATILVDKPAGPLLTVFERSVGTSRFAIPGTIVADVAATQEMRFHWLADGESYGASRYQYRYAWDLIDASRPENWDQDWCEDCSSAAPRSFDTGVHTFVLQARDDLGLLQEARYVLQVHALTGERDVLWVDDTVASSPGSDQEAREDARWVTLLSELSSEHGFSFDPIQDVYDIVDHNFDLPPIAQVFAYRSVIWSVREGSERSGLRRLAEFVDPFLERNAGRRTQSYLRLYLLSGGNLWINGSRPARNLWPALSAAQETRPVNVTNWDDDPVERHPGIDSAGTQSLLYTMGVQMFDCGAGPGCARQSPEHLCLGLERGMPQGSQVRTFRTDQRTTWPHTHFVDIPSADVEGGQVEAVVYATSFAADHRHVLQIGAEEFARLRTGQTITAITETAADPEPHEHAVDIRDDLGLWGAPTLHVGADWSDDATGGRPHVEIYNMPASMATSQPRLTPPAGLYVPLYTYLSGVQQDPNRGVFYPLTADEQPVTILAKGRPEEPLYSRAFMGFEPEALTFASHKALAEFLLVRHFRLGVAHAP